MGPTKDFPKFQRVMQRLMGLTGKRTTVQQLCAVAGDIVDCCNYIQSAGLTEPQLHVQQEHIGSQLVELTTISLSLTAKATPVGQELPAIVQTLCKALDFLIDLGDVIKPRARLAASLAGQQGLMSAWTLAAQHTACTTQQHIQQQQQQPTNAASSSRSSADPWVPLGTSLLELWAKVAFHNVRQQHKPLMATFEAAAELAQTLLKQAVTVRQAAARVQECGSFQMADDPTFQQAASVMVAACVYMVPRDIEVSGFGASKHKQLRSDSLQQVFVLSLACCISTLRQELTTHSSSSSSSSSSRGRSGTQPEVPMHHKTVIEQIGLAGLDDVQLGSMVSRHPTCSLQSPRAFAVQALLALNNSMNFRYAPIGSAMSRDQRATGAATQAPTTVTPVVAAPVMPLQLQLLLLESVLLARGADQAKVFSVGLQLMVMLQVQPIPDAACDASAAKEYLQQVWLQLGPAVMASAGSQNAEVEEGEGATVGGGPSSHRKIVVEPDDPNGEVQLEEQHSLPMGRKLVGMFGFLLFEIFKWIPFAEFETDILLPTFKQQPFFCSRILEAGLRTVRETYLWSASNAAQQLGGMATVLATVGAAAERGRVLEPGASSRLSNRLFSQLISGLKHTHVSIITSADLYWKVEFVLVQSLRAALALGQQVSDAHGPMHFMLAEKLGMPSLWSPATPGPFTSAVGPWMALTGRALMSFGSLLQVAPQWIAADGSDAGSILFTVLDQVQHAANSCYIAKAAVGWLSSLIQQFTGQPPVGGQASATGGSGPPMIGGGGGLDAATAQQLQQQAATLDQLLAAALHAMPPADNSPAALRHALVSFRAACAASRLSLILQLFGAGCWSAFPTKHACNDPNCSSCDGLTEMTAARSKCSGCKIAHYCSKDHQVCHWRMHKTACKQLCQHPDAARAAAATATPTGAHADVESPLGLESID